MLWPTYLYYMEWKIADFHNDALTAGVDLGLLSKETELCVCAIYTGERSLQYIRALASKFMKERRQNLFLSLEDASYLNDDNIEEVAAWAPVCVSLTWNGENALAGGCLSDGGLTSRGERMVTELSQKGIAIDVSHLNTRSFCELLDCCPHIVATHSCLNVFCNHPRNLADWQIKEITERGGIIGITLVTSFLGGQGRAEDVFRHIDYGVQKFGLKHFCLGTDFNGTSDLPRGVEGYCGAGRLAELFMCAGYDEDDIGAIFSGNLRAYLTENDAFRPKE